MATPIDFEGSTHVFVAEGYGDLPVAVQPYSLSGVATTAVISAWQFSPQEQAEFWENGGVVFLRVVGGQPPVEVTGINSIG